MAIMAFTGKKIWSKYQMLSLLSHCPYNFLNSNWYTLKLFKILQLEKITLIVIMDRNSAQCIRWKQRRRNNSVVEQFYVAVLRVLLL